MPTRGKGVHGWWMGAIEWTSGFPSLLVEHKDVNVKGQHMEGGGGEGGGGVFLALFSCPYKTIKDCI